MSFWKRGDIILNGNIGVGKSTLLKRLRDEHHYLIYNEPVDEWKFLLQRIYEGDKNLLPLFQWRVLFHFTHITEELLKLGENRNPVAIERSPRSVLLFVEQNRDHFDSAFYDSMESWVLMMEQFPFWRQAHTFLCTQSPHRCWTNMQNRAHVEKDIVPIDYLERLDLLHNQYALLFKWEILDTTDLDDALTYLASKSPRSPPLPSLIRRPAAPDPSLWGQRNQRRSRPNTPLTSAAAIEVFPVQD